MALTKKVRDRLERQFENATPEVLGEALQNAKHILNGSDDSAKGEAGQIKEFIESLSLKAEEIKLPAMVKVEAKNFVVVDGVQYTKGQSGQITLKQFKALSRHFIPDEATAELLKAESDANKKKRKEESALAKAAAIIIALLLLFAVSPASAQVYTITNPGGYNGGTNSMATNGAVTNILTVTKTKNFSFGMTTKLNAAGTGGIYKTVDTSDDGSNWVTGTQALWGAAAGTTLVTFRDDYSNSVAGYYRYTVVSSNSVNATNTLFKFTVPGVKAN